MLCSLCLLFLPAHEGVQGTEGAEFYGKSTPMESPAFRHILKGGIPPPPIIPFMPRIMFFMPPLEVSFFIIFCI